MIPFWPERSLDRRPHHFLVVLFGECAERLCIYTLPLLHHLLKSPWRHADQYHAGARPNVLEGVPVPRGTNITVCAGALMMRSPSLTLNSPLTT